MRRVVPVLLAAVAACSSTLYQNYVSATAAPPEDAYTCVQGQLKTLGYQRSQYDAGKHWFVGQRVDPTARVASPQFRKRIDILDVTVSADAGGQTRLAIKASTQDEYSNQRGLDRQDQQASLQVKTDARKLAEACAGPTATP
jgi:hypothetical protein